LGCGVSVVVGECASGEGDADGEGASDCDVGNRTSGGGEVSTLDGLITAMHDCLCGCGDRCAGWLADREALLEFAEMRWGSRYTFEWYLGAFDE
jgi:hypothetical protein